MGAPTGIELDDAGDISKPFDPEDIDVGTKPMTVDLLLSRIGSARSRPRPKKPPWAASASSSRRPARTPPGRPRSKRSATKARSSSLGNSDAWAIAETRSVRLKDFFLVRSFYFPIGSYAANLDLLRADRAKYERLIDATADSPLTASASSFGPLPRARNSSR